MQKALILSGLCTKTEAEFTGWHLKNEAQAAKCNNKRVCHSQHRA